MVTRTSSGFTIIETLLFLGITGLLVLGALIGTGANVNIQRYRDATETFKAVIQDQYADTANVQNGRQNGGRCNTAAGVVSDASGEVRGQSKCVVVGKYVRVSGGNISIYTVLARERATTTPTSDDLISLRSNYALNISRTEVEKRTMEWGTTITWPATIPGEPLAKADNNGAAGSARSIALLFLRSPDSGQVYTFSSNTVPTDVDIDNLSPTASPGFLTSMIVAGEGALPSQKARIICVNSTGLFDYGQSAVYIAPYATSSSSVELMSNDTMATRKVNGKC